MRSFIRRGILAFVVAGAMVFAAAYGIQAEEKKSPAGSQDGIREVLAASAGKRVSIRTDSGEALEGTVARVGEATVHIERLTGRDFYDAVVRIDRISSVIFRARGN